MTHETLREKVVDLALDALDPGEAREVEAHVAGCPGCAAELASLRATRSAMAGLPPLAAPERGEAVLLAAARQAAEQAEARRPGLLPRWFWGAALGAASAAAVVLVTLQLSSAPPTNRFDEGRDALAGRGPAPQPAAETAAPPAPATPTVARDPEAREARAAEAKEERTAGVAGAAAPNARPPSGGPPGDAGGRGEIGIGVPGAAGAAAQQEPAMEGSASAPTPQASNTVASSTAPPGSAPARARKAVADQDRVAEPLAALRAAPGSAERATASAEAPAESPRAGAMAADASAAEAKAGAPPPAKRDPQPSGFAAPASPPAGLGCPAERTRTLERDAAGRLVRRVRTGTLDGREYLAAERFGPEGRLLGATLLVDGREVALRAGDLEPLPGLRLAPTAAAAAAAPPACRP